MRMSLWYMISAGFFFGFSIADIFIGGNVNEDLILCFLMIILAKMELQNENN